MNQTRGSKRGDCANGCGRHVQGDGKTCAYCEAGHLPPEAKPALHRTEYLIACARELDARRAHLVKQADEIAALLKGAA